MTARRFGQRAGGPTTAGTSTPTLETAAAKLEAACAALAQAIKEMRSAGATARTPEEAKAAAELIELLADEIGDIRARVRGVTAG